MNARSAIALMLSCFGSLASGSSQAQQAQADVTFEIPLNLTRLHADVTSVKVTCNIESDGLRRLGNPGERSRSAEAAVPVTQGSVVQTVQVIIPVTDADLETYASGRQVNYECRLLAYRATWQNWRSFAAANLGDPVVAMTPAPTTIRGAFVW